MRLEKNYLYVDIQFDVPKFMFILKKSGLKCLSGFSLFLWWTQK